MWNPEKVERALFRWQKWRQSIVTQWINLEVEIESLTLGQLKAKARRELRKLSFPANLWLELYWICCITSDYNLDHLSSFDNIVIPTWLRLPFDPSLRWYKIELGTRMYPPWIWNEGDVEFEVRRHGNPGLREVYSKPGNTNLGYSCHLATSFTMCSANCSEGRPKGLTWLGGVHIIPTA